MSTITENLALVRERVDAAARRSGRKADDVTLVAVSKTQPVEAVWEAFQAGQRVFGENKVQEALGKIAKGPKGCEWHLVGHLQSNKAGKVPGNFTVVHSLDSSSLALELEKRAGAKDRPVEVLIQLNWSGEDTKSGVRNISDLGALMGGLLACNYLDPIGLMTIPDPEMDETATRKHFAQMRELLETIRKDFGLGPEFKELSMGMTEDFEWAIEEGSTIVRVGTAIFGKRNTLPKG